MNKQWINNNKMIQWNVLWRKSAQPWSLFPPRLDKPMTMNSQCNTVAKILNSIVGFRVVNMNRNLLMSLVSLLLLFIVFFFYLLAQAKKNSERRKGWVKCILNAYGFFKRFLQISLKPGKCENYKQPCFVFVWGKKLLFSKRKLKKRILQIALFRTLEARLTLMPRKAL